MPETMISVTEVLRWNVTNPKLSRSKNVRHLADNIVDGDASARMGVLSSIVLSVIMVCCVIPVPKKWYISINTEKSSAPAYIF